MEHSQIRWVEVPRYAKWWITLLQIANRMNPSTWWWCKTWLSQLANITLYSNKAKPQPEPSNMMINITRLELSLLTLFQASGITLFCHLLVDMKISQHAVVLWAEWNKKRRNGLLQGEISEIVRGWSKWKKHFSSINYSSLVQEHSLGDEHIHSRYPFRRKSRLTENISQMGIRRLHRSLSESTRKRKGQQTTLAGWH